MNGCVHRTTKNICKYYSHGDVVSYCDLENCDSVVPSNYDKIHAMPEEELADFIAIYMDCQICPIRPDRSCVDSETCRKLLLDWLKQEAKR